ncbi:hypothetical protein EXIGLDRAFT_686001 [Exidia glandulosa HHB12029]|uniref:Polysaccharide lyase 14 domain-containing protein n=1 Tax=Exidia glandulosa HHB12029 TaxID=1314781 RepID=A0A165BXW9_EXIGL|nr:hypothetical protein EXIGLDRAFT_686001 [Exidia glandulosa HHB12029]
MLLSSLVQLALVSAAFLSPMVEAHHHDKDDKSTKTSKHPKPTKTPKPCKGKKCSTTTTSSSPTPTSTSTPGGNSTGLNPTWLFPVQFQSGWSTAPPSPALPQDNEVKRVPLSDSDLNVEKNTKGVTHDVVDAVGAPSGTRAWEAFYPKGSYNPSGTPRGGFGFYFSGPSSFDFTKATELLFSYAVKFEDGFDWNKGGKLPGPYGGTTEELAYGCSGGRQDARDACFDLRLMFRANGAGEIYAYLPDAKENDVLLQIKGSEKNPKYGFSIARGAYTFPTGEWTVVSERIKLNDADKANGEIELFVNGKSVINASGLVIRQHPEAVFRGAHFQTFFGGSSKDWGSPKDQKAWFADVSAAIIA